jgi:DNA replication protein DnaC
MSQSVALLLKDLKLPAFLRHYQAMQEHAVAHGWSHGRYLEALAEKEVADRYQKRVQRWTREAELPSGKSFATLNRAVLAAANQQKILHLREHIDWARRADNVVLIGPSGVGKTHIAAALGLHLVEQGLQRHRHGAKPPAG